RGLSFRTLVAARTTRPSTTAGTGQGPHARRSPADAGRGRGSPPGSRLLDRNADGVPPLRPRPVVVADGRVAEELGQHEPGVARPLADPAVDDDVVLRREPDLLGVDRLEGRNRLERAVVVGRPLPGDAGRAGDVPAPQ